MTEKWDEIQGKELARSSSYRGSTVRVLSSQCKYNYYLHISVYANVLARRVSSRPMDAHFWRNWALDI